MVCLINRGDSPDLNVDPFTPQKKKNIKQFYGQFWHFGVVNLQKIKDVKGLAFISSV